MDQRYVGTNISSEFFNTAGRTVKTGLTAAVIVSHRIVPVETGREQVLGA